MLESRLPHPPLQLAERVGSLADSSKPFDRYDELGRLAREDIVRSLPAGWSFCDKRILDFGCGAGRTLRHFVAEAEEAEVWGCDVDTSSISWMGENICPPFQVFANEPEPPLDHGDASFDLVWGISVFTHLTDSWSRWLTELHRVLRPEGLVYLTFMGSGIAEVITGERWSEQEIGMNITKCGQSWDLGGPMVLHSPWWIKEHWGRGFEIVSLVPDGFATTSAVGQGSVLMRKRDEAVNPELFEMIRPDDDREARALAHNVDQLRRETVSLAAELALTDSRRLNSAELRCGQLEAEARELRARLTTIAQSKSWRMTAPLRGVARKAREAAG